jgi:hypothetical protein
MMAALVGPAATSQEDEEPRRKSSARLEAMRRLAQDVKVCEITDGKPGPPLALRPEPLLRYSIPAGNLIDGTLWRWGERGRPSAVLKLGLRGPSRGQRFWNFNVTALAPKPIDVEFSDGRRWSSRPPGELRLRSVPDAPGPASSAAQRLTQVRAIARRFSISLEGPKARRAQQRLTQPLDRYSDPEAGLLDGVLFAFVGATNPTVLLILEAWSEGEGNHTWRYAFAAVQCRRDGPPRRETGLERALGQPTGEYRVVHGSTHAHGPRGPGLTRTQGSGTLSTPSGSERPRGNF